MTQQEKACPVWDEQERGEVLCLQFCHDDHYAPRVYAPRAGGLFALLPQEQPTSLSAPVVYLDHHELESWWGRIRLTGLTPREKANLSYRIYRYNWDQGFLRPRDPQQRRLDVCRDAIERRPSDVYVQEVAGNRAVQDLLVQPPMEERLLTFVRELVWQKDREGQFPPVFDQEQGEYLPYLQAAAACAAEAEMQEFWTMALDQGWIQINYPRVVGSLSEKERNPFSYVRGEPYLVLLTLKARLWVEEQERKQGIGKQGFVAMWFDESLGPVYWQGFRRAIQGAGYEAHRIDDDPNHSDNLVDRILAAIRQSRFVVADFTCGSIQNQQGRNSVSGPGRRLLRGRFCLRAGHSRYLHLPAGCRGPTAL